MNKDNKKMIWMAFILVILSNIIGFILDKYFL